MAWGGKSPADLKPRYDKVMAEGKKLTGDKGPQLQFTPKSYVPQPSPQQTGTDPYTSGGQGRQIYGGVPPGYQTHFGVPDSQSVPASSWLGQLRSSSGQKP